MAKIPGIAFLALGLVLFFISRTMGKLAVFVYVGYIFIAYGSAKVIINYILKKDKSGGFIRKDKRLPEDLGNEMQGTRNNARRDKGKAHGLLGYIGYCQGCGTPMRKINLFCHRCGLRQQ